MFQRSGYGLRRAVVVATAVVGLGMMAGGAIAADKGNGHEEYGSAAPNCSVDQNWSQYRKCGDTEHQLARAESTRVREIEQPTDNEPVGATVDRTRN